jgi:hypothetical protein
MTMALKIRGSNMAIDHHNVVDDFDTPELRQQNAVDQNPATIPEETRIQNKRFSKVRNY